MTDFTFDRELIAVGIDAQFGIEQHVWITGIDLGVHADVDSQEFSFEIQIVKLLSIPPPSRLDAAVRGHLTFLRSSS